MSTIDLLRHQLKGYGASIVLYTFIILLAVILFVLSLNWDLKKVALMDSYQDCSWVHTLPRPDNCASSKLMRDYEDLGNRSKVALAGSLVLISALIALPLLRSYRRSSGPV